MKKVLFLFMSILVIMSVLSCNHSNNVGQNNEIKESFKAGEIALAKIKIGSVEFENTTQVYVTGKEGAIIEGKAHTYDSTGVFIEGRRIKLSPYIISKYEVTQELYTAVMTGQTVTINGEEKTLSGIPFFCTEDNDDYKKLLEGEEQKYRAADGITWYDAVYFCNVLSEKTNLTKAYNITVITVNSNGNITDATVKPVHGANGYRLPTEAEWEFAARGGDPTKPEFDYYFSGAAKVENMNNSINEGMDIVGWYKYNTSSGTTGNDTPTKGSAGYGTHHVGKKTANTLGLFDMSGNVWEWCFDYYTGNITQNDSSYTIDGIVTNPMGPDFENQEGRIPRGGGWNDASYICSVFGRFIYYPYCIFDYLGLRIVRSVQ